MKNPKKISYLTSQSYCQSIKKKLLSINLNKVPRTNKKIILTEILPFSAIMIFLVMTEHKKDKAISRVI